MPPTRTAKSLHPPTPQPATRPHCTRDTAAGASQLPEKLLSLAKFWVAKFLKIEPYVAEWEGEAAERPISPEIHAWLVAIHSPFAMYVNLYFHGDDTKIFCEDFELKPILDSMPRLRADLTHDIDFRLFRTHIGRLLNTQDQTRHHLAIWQKDLATRQDTRRRIAKVKKWTGVAKDNVHVYLADDQPKECGKYDGYEIVSHPEYTSVMSDNGPIDVPTHSFGERVINCSKKQIHIYNFIARERDATGRVVPSVWLVLSKSCAATQLPRLKFLFDRGHDQLSPTEVGILDINSLWPIEHNDQRILFADRIDLGESEDIKFFTDYGRRTSDDTLSVRKTWGKRGGSRRFTGKAAGSMYRNDQQGDSGLYQNERKKGTLTHDQQLHEIAIGDCIYTPTFVLFPSQHKYDIEQTLMAHLPPCGFYDLCPTYSTMRGFEGRSHSETINDPPRTLSMDFGRDPEEEDALPGIRRLGDVSFSLPFLGAGGISLETNEGVAMGWDGAGKKHGSASSPEAKNLVDAYNTRRDILIRAHTALKKGDKIHAKQLAATAQSLSPTHHYQGDSLLTSPLIPRHLSTTASSQHHIPPAIHHSQLDPHVSSSSRHLDATRTSADHPRPYIPRKTKETTTNFSSPSNSRQPRGPAMSLRGGAGDDEFEPVPPALEGKAGECSHPTTALAKRAAGKAKATAERIRKEVQARVDAAAADTGEHAMVSSVAVYTPYGLAIPVGMRAA